MIDILYWISIGTAVYAAGTLLCVFALFVKAIWGMNE